MLCPPELTQVLQPIDRSRGILYKLEVYRAVRGESMKLLRERKEKSPGRLTALAKRVLITRADARVHERLAARGTFRRAFIATGT